jgi:sugar lactone lactonase YvrE
MAGDAAARRVGDEAVTTPDVVVAGRYEVGEGPVFDPRTGRLCWVDINGGLVCERDLATGEQVEHEVGLAVGAAVPRAEAEGFALAVADGLGFWNGELDLVEPLLADPDMRFNDAKCDSHGRLWAGSCHVAFEPGRGALHRWDGRGQSIVARGGFALPNGLGWTVDDRTMYFVDTFGYTLFRADFDVDAGEVGEFAPLATFDDSGWPDGLAVDVDGCVWLALWGGWEVRRIAPTGETVASVTMPVAQPSSCAFGGDGTLYITSAAAGLGEEELAAQPHAGSIFAVSTTTQGVPVHPFGA